MNRFCFVVVCSVINITCHAQRYDRTRTYDVIGLPNGEEVWDCICKAFPFILLGLTIIGLQLYGQKHTAENSEDKGSWWGCLGFVLIGVGVIMMLPLLAWVEAFFVSVVSAFGFIGLLCLIWMWITGRLGK